jgi:NagD protein
MQTVLVLSGLTRRKDVDGFPFKPGRIVDSVADLIE